MEETVTLIGKEPYMNEGIRSLVGKDLTSFRFIEMFAVHPMNEQTGYEGTPTGVFKHKSVGIAFAKAQTTGEYMTSMVTVLTDGVLAFIIDSGESVKLFNDEEEGRKLGIDTSSSPAVLQLADALLGGPSEE